MRGTLLLECLPWFTLFIRYSEYQVPRTALLLGLRQARNVHGIIYGIESSSGGRAAHWAVMRAG